MCRPGWPAGWDGLPGLSRSRPVELAGPMSEQPRQQHDMWADPEADPRTAIPDGRGEKAVLTGYLDRYRMTLELKCQDLDPEQLGRRSVPPSALSLLGLVRHLARVEQHWFRRILQGQDLPRLLDDEDAGFSFGSPTPELVAASWELWHGEVDHAREVYAALDLDAPVEIHGEQHEVRDVVVHMVEEYARHVGHADLLREAIDGRTGQ